MTDNILTEEQIEAYIDRHGLLHLLTAIELICAEKADHIRANWQDDETARGWDRDSTVVGRAARQVRN